MNRFVALYLLFFACLLATGRSAGAGLEHDCSRPAGFMRILIASNEQKLVSLPFQPFDPSVKSIFSGQDQPDAVLRWDNNILKYEEAYRAANGSYYSDPGRNVISGMELFPGEGFVLWNMQDSEKGVFLSGNVILSATNAIELGRSLNIIGYPYTSSGTSSMNSSFMEMGQGSWFNNTSDVSVIWVEVRPYADVFPPEGEKPAITEISIKDGKEAVLTIEASGTQGERLDVFYKDITSTGMLDTATDWLIAETDIPVKGRKQVKWTDTGNFAKKPVYDVFARYYLIGRADIDSDKDGVPDARARFVFGKGQSVGNIVVTGSVGQADMNYPGTNSLSSSSLVINSGVNKYKLLTKIIYVDQGRGSDKFSGRSVVVIGNDGPKKTISSGVITSDSGDEIVVNTGRYSENLNVAGRNVKVTFNGRVDLTGKALATPQSVMPVVHPLANGVNTNLPKNIK